MPVRVLLLLLGVFQAINGLWMLASPDGWYWTIPGVSMTGPANHHFILDIGMAFVASGTGLAAGFARGARAATLAAAGATWPMLHALIHVAGWFTHGIPTTAPLVMSDVAGVVGLSSLGVALAWFRAKGEIDAEISLAQPHPADGAKIRL